MGPRSEQYPEVYAQQGGLEVSEQKTSGYSLVGQQQDTSIPQRRGGANNRNPFGLGAATFGLLIALVTLFIVGAGLGGGLGGALASARKKGSSTTVTRTATTTIFGTPSLSTTATATSASGTYTNFTVPSAQQIDTLFLDCPNLNNTAYSAPNNQQFTFICGIAYPGGYDSYSGGKIATLSGLIAYTPEDCASACSTFNAYSKEYGNGTVCAAATFSAGFAEHPGANCWLFNTTGPPELSAVAVSAVLQ